MLIDIFVLCICVYLLFHYVYNYLAGPVSRTASTPEERSRSPAACPLLRVPPQHVQSGISWLHEPFVPDECRVLLDGTSVRGAAGESPRVCRGALSAGDLWRAKASRLRLRRIYMVHMSNTIIMSHSSYCMFSLCFVNMLSKISSRKNSSASFLCIHVCFMISCFWLIAPKFQQLLLKSGCCLL